jgi:hypothetical protein
MKFLSFDGSPTATFQAVASIQLHPADPEEQTLYENVTSNTS